MQLLNKHKNSIDYQEMSSYMPDYCFENSSFLEEIYPVRFKFLRSFLGLFLPTELLFQFISWQNNHLQADFFNKLEAAVGKKIEVFSRPVANFAPKYMEFKLFFAADDTNGVVHEHVYGFGQSFFTSGEAVTKAIGEFLERYYLAVDWKNNTFVSTKKKLGRRALNLENTPCYLESQKKIEESFITKTDLDDSAFGWVQAKSVFGLFKTYVPAQRVFWMPQQDTKLGTLNHATSNGNAGHFSKQMTILSSIYELVERDGFMYYWLCKISPTQIDTSSIESPAMEKQREFITRYKLQVSFFDITTAVNIPSVLCVVVDTSDANDPKVSIGASAGFNVDKLIDGSFMEALVVQRHHTANRAKDIAFDTASHFDDKDFDGKELNNRIYFWRGKEAMRCLQFMYDGKKTTYTKFKEQYEVKVFTSVKVEYKFVKKLFSGLIQEFGSAYTPYIYTVKDRFLSTIGYHVTSAVVMGLYPLYMVEYKVCLDIRDIAHWKETSKEKGVAWKGIVQNTHPHPFP